LKPAAKAVVQTAAVIQDDAVETLLELISDSLDDAKAEDVTTIDLRGKTSLADYMIIATGRSDRHVGAIAQQIIQKMKDGGRGLPRVEGMPQCDWVLVDANDIIVHVFRSEVRQFYNLEKMWSGDRPAERARDA
jgi:ribosome-associated protein